MEAGENGIEGLVAAAENGDVDAQFELARHYERLDPPDEEKSHYWDLKAARGGITESQVNVALNYRLGSGVRPDSVLSNLWIIRASVNGHDAARGILASRCMSGSILPRNEREGLHWMSLALVSSDNPRALRDYGMACVEGKVEGKDAADGAAMLQKAAERGLADAQSALAGLYRTGNGVPQVPAQALRWARAAAEGGDADGMIEMHHLYEYGIGVERSEEESARWLARAAEGGSDKARTLLGERLISGTGVGRDVARGLTLVRAAAEDGHPRAQYVLGKLHFDGVVVPRDDEEAYAWFRIAASNGEDEALYHLAGCYLDGLGVPADYDAARSILMRLADDGHHGAMLEVVIMALVPGEGYLRDETVAFKCANLAASAGAQWAPYALGLMAHVGCGCPRSPSRAASWYRRGDEMGCPESQYELASMLERGAAGVPEDGEAALRLLEKSAHGGNAKARARLGMKGDVRVAMEREGFPSRARLLRAVSCKEEPDDPGLESLVRLPGPPMPRNRLH